MNETAQTIGVEDHPAGSSGGQERGGQERGGEERGRDATSPLAIPAKGWKDIAYRVWAEIGDDRVGLIAAGIAFYALLALFPAIAAGISLWGLFADPAVIERQFAGASRILPQEAAALLMEQAHAVASSAGAGLTLAAMGGVLFSLYSASKGVGALMDGLNQSYDEQEKRGFVGRTITAIGIAAALVVGALAAAGAMLALPGVLGALGLGEVGRTIASWLRWPLLFLLVMTGLALIYRYAPCRAKPRWQWVSPGALVATALWVVASIGFSFYVRAFGNYNETYGSLGAAIIALMWLWLSAYIVLLGAEINAELERQTRHDTTSGPAKPMGQRDAYSADTVGEAHEGKK